IIHLIEQHQKTHDLIIFPELALCGYPPEDLLFCTDLFEQVSEALKKIQSMTTTCVVVLGHPERTHDGTYNALSLFYDGACLGTYHKQKLPHYGVFDEPRYFQMGPKKTCIIPIKHYKVGFCICEDLWQKGPVEALVKEGIDCLVSINASPFDAHKADQRTQLIRQHALKGIGIVYLNLVGGQDELVFDGQSFAMDKHGVVQASAQAFCEEHLSISYTGETFIGSQAPQLKHEALIYQALCCGLRDYVKKNGFKSVLLGLSGGVDSALTLAIAVDALGSSNVHAVLMPSRYTAKMSLDDALEEAEILHVRTSIFSIEPTFNAMLSTLPPQQDIALQNLQARIRGMMLMALSNTTGALVLTTSNKSETAVGYATLYGDMCGGFSVLKDVLKTDVYQLAHHRNSLSQVIPLRVLTRPPSAELAEDQTDQQTLPPYEILDHIITALVEHKLTPLHLIQQGYEEQMVYRVAKLIQRNEYKRRQSAPGVKISPCAFGRDWRFPITSGFSACKIEPNR
ncbi:MAG: NAD+ synthase, partial [Legionellaceae bacterium]